MIVFDVFSFILYSDNLTKKEGNRITFIKLDRLVVINEINHGSQYVDISNIIEMLIILYDVLFIGYSSFSDIFICRDCSKYSIIFP